MNIVFWNCRGIGGGGKDLDIKKLIMEKRVSFLGFIETKHSLILHSKIKRWRGVIEMEWSNVGIVEGYGGLICS